MGLYEALQRIWTLSRVINQKGAAIGGLCSEKMVVWRCTGGGRLKDEHLFDGISLSLSDVWCPS